MDWTLNARSNWKKMDFGYKILIKNLINRCCYIFNFLVRFSQELRPRAIEMQVKQWAAKKIHTVQGEERERIGEKSEAK